MNFRRANGFDPPMSALDGWIDVFRTGAHRDSGGRVRRWAEDDLDRLVAAFERGDPVPVVVGHPEADAPAFGRVAGLRRVGDRLQARLDELDPGFRAAVAAGRYSGRSVALDRTGEGGFRLRHLGFLGAAAPAVAGLAPSRFSARPAAAYLFDRRMEETMTEDDADAGREALEAERRELEEARRALAAAEARRAAEDALDAHVAAGRVLPAEKDGLAAFMAGLGDDEAEVLTFARPGAEGGGATATPRAFFADFLARLPRRVAYGEVAGTGGALAPADPHSAARAARELMAADSTGALTIDRAVRRVFGKE